MIPMIYKNTHAAHHIHTTPMLYDAFDGSVLDTGLMILLPLLITSRFVNANIWSYMTFGTIYANMLTLIHSKEDHPWDPYARTMGIGTAEDHRVHHKTFKWNYGHIFTYWDRICDTYLEY